MKKIQDLNYYELLEISTDSSSQDVHRAYERMRKIYEPNSIALYSLFSPEETTAISQRIEDAYRTLAYEEPRKRYDALLRQAPEPKPAAAVAIPIQKSYQALPLQPSLTLDTENPYLKKSSVPTPEPPPPNLKKSFEPLPEPLPPMPTAMPVVAPLLQPLPSTITEFTGAVLASLREQRELTIRNIAEMTKLGTRYIEFIETENFSKLPARTYIRGFLGLYAKALGYEPERLISEYMKRYDAAMNPVKQK